MSWKESCVMSERVKFILACQEDVESFSQTCLRFGISRRVGYKWVNRFKEAGFEGLKERSRAPINSHNKISEELSSMILEARCNHMTWGPRKIIAWLQQEHPEYNWPASSTAGELLKKNGLVSPRKKRKRVQSYTKPFGEISEPNDSWSIDYKGQFRLQSGLLCYPLTLSDNFSRFVLACDGFHKISGHRVMNVLTSVFREYGLPKVIRSDNGSPFASTGLGSLTFLNVWLMKLGIVHERIRPGHPEENGRHERMHRTLKAETAKPPKSNMVKQRVAFKAFQQEFNYGRPHEALDNQRPAWVHRKSNRIYPGYLNEVEYSFEYTVRRVRQNGSIKWRGKEVYLSDALVAETIGLLAVSEEEWIVCYGSMHLGILDERLMKVMPLRS